MSSPRYSIIEAARALRTRTVPRWAWWATAGVFATAGLAWGWGWLTAVGLASVIISLLPCALMCALGLCMSRGNRSSSSCHGANESPVSQANDKDSTALPSVKP